MTATYDPTLADNVSLVRYHIGDTDVSDVSAARLSNEEIQHWLDNSASLGEAVVTCIEGMIAQLSVPNFTADWLTVDAASARKGYQELLAIKRRSFGLTGITSKFKPIYRKDSQQTDAPDFASASKKDPSFPYQTRP